MPWLATLLDDGRGDPRSGGARSRYYAAVLLLLLACDPGPACAAVTLHADADGDGYGDGAITDVVCPQFGWVDDATDCDDADTDVHPAAVEVCDPADRDEDCSGAADEADPGLTPPTWYLDADGDTYGLGTTARVGCDPDATEVADGTDCDDTDPTVSPGASERCDERDTDCDPGTDEAGLASFASEDWTARFGVVGSAPDLTLDAPGTLVLCGGTWYAHLVVTADVTVRGVGTDVVLDGQGTGAVIDVRDATLDLRDLTLTNGAAERGGALACEGSLVQIEDVWVRDSVATTGGGIATQACSLYMWRGGIRDTSAEEGGAVWVASGSVELNYVDIVDTTASITGGALHIAPADAEEAFVSMGESLVTGSAAPTGAAAFMRGDAELLWYGTVREQAGALANRSETGGVIAIEGDAAVEFVRADLGEPDTADDNQPIDVSTAAGDYRFGDDLLGWCWDEGCTLL